MNDLIKIQQQNIGGQTIETVNARELHSFLEVGKMFANWIKDRIDQYNFIENLDYVVIAEIGNNPSGGRPSKEYSFVEETDFRSKMSKSSSGCQF